MPSSPVIPEASDHQSKGNLNQTYCLNSLKGKLAQWQKEDEDYFVVQKNGSRRPITVAMDSFEDERTKYIDAVEELHHILDRMPSL
jgi:hypothetical protein